MRSFASRTGLRIQCRFAKWLDLKGFLAATGPGTAGSRVVCEMSTERKPALDPDLDDLDEEGSSVATWIVLGTAIVLAGGLGWYALAGRNEAPPPDPGAVLADPAANFTTIEGSVKVKNAGRVRWDDAERQATLRENDLVRTGVRSTADIEFIDATEVNVRPESLITIQRPGAAGHEPARSAMKMTVSSGEVSFRRQREEGSAEVSTPTLRSTISERASANIRVDSGGDSDIRLFAGRGRVETTAGDSVELAENEGLRVDAEGRAGPKVALPDAPGLVAPADAAELPEPVPPRDPLQVAWTGVEAARDYRVQVGADAAFAEVVFEGRSGGATRLALPRLALGSYHWRVSAIAGDDAEGGFSERRRFEVVPPPSGPALEVTALEVRGNIAQIQGRTRPGSRLTVDGNEIPVQADGSFDEFVTLVGSGDTLVVRSVGPDGGVSQIERPLRRQN